MFCSNCGKEISDNQNYCNYCGTKVNNNSVDNTNLNEDELTNKIIENKDNIANAVNYVMKNKKLDQPSARKYVDKVFKDNGIEITTNNTSSKTTKANVIKISFTKTIIVTVLLVLFVIIPIIISSINRNNTPLNKDSVINTEMSDLNKKIDIAGITQEEREELTSILQNFNPAERDCEVIGTIGNYYQDFGMHYIIAGSRTGINEKGYIYDLSYDLIDKETNENKGIEVNVTYSFDNNDRPIKIRFDDTNSTVSEYNAFSKNALYEITYLDNGMIGKINCTLYKDNTRVEYIFSYKANNDYDKVKVLFYGDGFVKGANHLITFNYFDNKIMMSKGEDSKFYFERDDIISQENLSEYFNTLLFQSFIKIDETTVINQSQISLLEKYYPFVIKKSLYYKYFGEWYSSYNEDGLIDTSYNKDYTTKLKHNYIKVDNKVLQIETEYKGTTINKVYSIYSYDENNKIDRVYKTDNIETLRNAENKPASILDNLDDALHPSEDDYNIENYYGNSYYMYVYLTDEKIRENTFEYELQLLGGIYKDNLKVTNGKVTLYVKKSLYDKVYNKLKTLTGVKNIEKTTTVVNQETVKNTSKYLMQIWGKDNKFLSREFYTFCSNYR